MSKVAFQSFIAHHTHESKHVKQIADKNKSPACVSSSFSLTSVQHLHFICFIGCKLLQLVASTSIQPPTNNDEDQGPDSRTIVSFDINFFFPTISSFITNTTYIIQIENAALEYKGTRVYRYNPITS